MRLLPKQFSDLVTFTRASGGTSFRPVGYGPDKITGIGPQAATLSGVDLVENTASANHGIRLTNSTSAARAEFRFRAKAGTKSWLWAYFENYSAGSAWFDLSTGSVGTQEPGVVATMTAAGGGYFDCVLTKWNFSTALNCNIYAVTANGSTAAYLGTGSVAFQIASYSVQEAILDRAGDPIQLFTAPANTPRIDYDPVSGACKGLLIEEQRTNLVANSLLSGWSGPAVVTQNATASPDGGVNGVLVSNLTNGNKFTSCTVSAGTYTVSGYVKKGNSSTVAMEWNGVVAWGVGFNFDTLVANNCSATPVGGGWYRIVASIVVPSAGSLNVFAYGNGGFVSAAGETYWWGVQLELGSFPTSYIPTTGAAATRAADVATVNTLSPWFNQGEGTLFASFGLLAATATFKQITVIGNGVASPVNEHSLMVAPDAQVRLEAPVAGSYGSGYQNFGASSTSARAAYAWSGSAIAGAVNGGAVSEKTMTAGLPTGLNRLLLGANRNTSDVLNGHIRQIRYIPKRLTNAELQALTA